MVRLSIRIDFEPSGSALGPGMAEMLERVDQLGSIRKAAASMDMSYRKAWLLLHGMQLTFGRPAVSTETGGPSGGGARLTELGRDLLRIYRIIQTNAAQSAEKEMQLLSGMVQKDAAPRAKGKARARQT